MITKECYIGSATDLARRFRDYFRASFLEKELSNNRSKISDSLLKYGYSNFSLSILEYCDSDLRIKREQYYIDTLDPEYNICKIAGSRLGVKHSPETLLRIRNYRRSSEAIHNHLAATGHIVIIINKSSKSIRKYDSIRKAAKSLGATRGALLYCIKKNKLYKKNYSILRFYKLKFLP